MVAINDSTTYSSGRPRQCVKSKQIFYKCGCVVRLEEWGESHAPPACKKHHKEIDKIITTDKFLD